MVRQTAKVIALEVVAGLILLVALLAVGLAVRLAAGPIELGMFRDDVEQALVRARDGRQVHLSGLSLEWIRREGRLAVTANGVDFLDDRGHVAARAERTEILLATRDLIRRRIEPIGLFLDDGFIEVRESAEGWMVAGEPLGPVGPDNLGEGQRPLIQMLGRLDTTMQDVLVVLEREANSRQFEDFGFQDVELRIYRGADMPALVLRDARGTIQHDEAGVTASVSALSDDIVTSPRTISAEVNIPPEFDRLTVSFAFNDWSLAALLEWVPDLPAKAENVALNFATRFDISRANGISGVSFQAEATGGTLIVDQQDIDVRAFEVAGDYDAAPDRLTVKSDRLDIGVFTGVDMVLQLDDVLARETARPFEFRSSQFAIDFASVFGDDWPFQDVMLEGLLDVPARRVDLSSATVRLGAATVIARGDVVLPESAPVGAFPVELDLVAQLSGRLPTENVLRFWPLAQAPGARNFVSQNVLDGEVTETTAIIRMTPTSRQNGVLDDQAIDVSFAASGVSVKPLRDLPPIVGASLLGQVTGNTMRLDFSGGRFGLWNVEEGFVHYPQLAPAGADMMIGISGRGPARNLAKIISDSRLQIEARSGFNPAHVLGDGEMTFELRRPAIPNSPISALRYSGEGRISRGGLKEAFSGRDLTDADANVSLDQTGMAISGFGNFANSPLRFRWAIPFGAEGAPATLTASSVVTPDTLNTFDIVGRAYFTGEAPIEVDARLDGNRIRDVTLDLDLTDARIDVAELGWVKPKGEPADGAVSLSPLADREGSAIGARFKAEDAAFNGTVSLEPNGRLILVDLTRAYLEERFDLSGTAGRTDGGGLEFDLSGPFLDLSRLIGNVTTLGTGPSAAARIGDVTLVAAIDRLTLRDGFDMFDSKLDLVSSAEGLQLVEAAGNIRTGARFTAAYDASGLGDPAFRVTSGDASFLASVFLGLDSLEDGELEMTGTLSRGDFPTQILINITDGRLKDAPVLTQLLSLASIRGVSDTLAGDGVLFST
ncbi:MAG: DUF3971 domain-containing protein, partial [Pseudomonadota bacterium]